MTSAFVDAGPSVELTSRQVALQQALQAVGVAAPTFGNELHFVRDDEVLWTARRMLMDAPGWVGLACFDWHPDEGGSMLPAALVHAVRNNQRAFALADGFGGRLAPVRAMHDAGVNVRVFGALTARGVVQRRMASAEDYSHLDAGDPSLRAPTVPGGRASRMFSGRQFPFHSHRKHIIASDLADGLGPDARTMLVGTNQGDDWLIGGWRDNKWVGPLYDSGFAVKGPAVPVIAGGFADVFRKGQPLRPRRSSSWNVHSHDLSVTAPVYEVTSDSEPADLFGGVQPYASEPTPAASGIATLEFRVMKQLFAHASRKVTVVTPMVEVMPEMLEIIRSAVERGVEVEVLTNGPCMRDIGVRSRTVACYPQLLAAGAQVYEIQNAEIHDKGTIVDDVAIRKGSANFNIRSLVEDQENGAVIYDVAAIASYSAYVDEMRNNCRAVNNGDAAKIKASVHGHMSMRRRLVTKIVMPIFG